MAHRAMSFKFSRDYNRRRNSLILKNRSVRDIAWLAGIVEGEGCFSFNSGYARIVVKMCDRDIIERVANLWNDGNYYISAAPSKRERDQYAASVRGKTAIGWMFTLYSFMGERRRAKIREVLHESGCYDRQTCESDLPRGHSTI